MILRWVRRGGDPKLPAHVLVDDQPVCRHVNAPPLRPLLDAELAPTGRPYGRLCEQCEAAARRYAPAEAPTVTSLRVALRETRAGVDRRPLYQRALEARRAGRSC